MGTVYQIDQATWSTMRMLQDARDWCKERNGDASRRVAVKGYQATLDGFIDRIHGEAA